MIFAELAGKSLLEFETLTQEASLNEPEAAHSTQSLFLLHILLKV
jgi:hypothetical protein